MAIAGRAKKVTTHTLQEMKRAGENITMLTSYDYSLARLVDGAGIDVILVGDSASNVMAGNDTTVPIYPIAAEYLALVHRLVWTR